jgi:hypothetical protein
MERTHIGRVEATSVINPGLGSAMFASNSSQILPTWRPMSRPVMRNSIISATLRAIVLVVLMFGALICGFLAGMTAAAVLCPSERGVMDTPY